LKTPKRFASDFSINQLMKRTTTVAIIGTAGRGADADSLLSRETFERMARRASEIILNEWKFDTSALTLVSGGSAWCDHVAVDLFLNDAKFQHSKLLLYLPCKFSKKFIDEKSWHGCGSVLNELHQNFSAKLGRSSLADIQLASQKAGATIDATSCGFFARNIRVGRVDRMIAFSAGAGNRPTDGGTAHTWKNSSTPQAYKRHISLQSLHRPPCTNLFNVKPKSATKPTSHAKTVEKASFVSANVGFEQKTMGMEKKTMGFEKKTVMGIADTIPVVPSLNLASPTPIIGAPNDSRDMAAPNSDHKLTGGIHGAPVVRSGCKRRCEDEQKFTEGVHGAPVVRSGCKRRCDDARKNASSSSSSNSKATPN
jgi:hypothetical protein